jgi:uncharacterized protein YfaT (DUF1175 family)
VRSPSLLAGAAFLLAALAGVLWPAETRVRADREAVFADGRDVVRLSAERRSVVGVSARLPSGWRLEADPRALEELGVTTLPAHDGSLVFRAGYAGGELPWRLVDDEGHAQQGGVVRFVVDPTDADADGLPDVAALVTDEDRAAFTAWFTAIAEGQATALDDAWARVHQDCAGLVRFAVREALREHDGEWLKARRYLPSVSAPDVRGARYPDLPFLGDLPFRARGGSFDADAPRADQFTAAASARTLWQHNSELVSRHVRDARAGDLLFFRVPYASGSRMHTMVVLGDKAGATHHDVGSRVVYHTGQPGDAGVVKLVTLEQLAAHPDGGWHPVPHNPRFLGVHRLSLVVHTARDDDGLALRSLPGGRT